MADPLSDEQLQYVREFFTSETAKQMFQKMQDGLVSDWINAQDAASREFAWFDLQALLRLAVTLRDAAADKHLTMRRQPTGV